MLQVTRRLVLQRIPHRYQRVSVCSGRSFSRLQTRDNYSAKKLKWSYDYGRAPAPLIGATIGQMLEEKTEKHPDKEAAVFPQTNQRITFETMLEESDRLAAGLLELGIRRGERVGILAPNCKEWLLTMYGAARAGFVLVNLNPAYQVPELEHALHKVNVKALIMAETFKTQDYYDMVSTICPELDTCTPGHLVSHRLPDLTSVIMISDKKRPGVLSVNEVMNDLGTPGELRFIKDSQNELQFDDPINIQFTSGTTGVPKGAVLSHHNLVNNAYFIGHVLGYHTEEARICVPVPLFHCFGMVIGALQSPLHSSTCVFPSPGFDPQAAVQTVPLERCTALYGTPTMFIDMLYQSDLASYDLTSLRTGVMAGSPCPEEVMRQVNTRMHIPEMTIAYGTTENSPVTFQTLRDDSLEDRVSTIGCVHPHIETKVVDEHNQVVPVGTPGELCIRGYCVMHGYFNDPEKTREVMADDRWYKTGDIVVMREDGYTRIEGRIKDMILRGGENIYPVEVEQLLYLHPSIEDVQVVGVPDPRLGEQVCAYVKLKQESSATADDVKDFCRGKISHFKIPHYVVFVEEFPLTLSGKVKKFKIREDALERLGLHKQ